MKQIKPQRTNIGIGDVNVMKDTLHDIKRDCVLNGYHENSSKYRAIAWRAIPCIYGIRKRLDTLERILAELADEYAIS